MTQTPETAAAGGVAGADPADSAVSGALHDPALTALSSDRLLDELLARLCAVMHAQVGQFLLVEDEVLRPVASHGIPIERVADVRVPVGRGFVGTVAGTASPAIMSDTAELDEFGAWWAGEGVRALVGVPLIVEGRVIGVAVVGSRTDHTFGDHDIALLTDAAERAAWAVEHGILLAAERRARGDAETVSERLRRLRSIAEELLSDVSVEGVVSAVVERGLSLIGAFGGAVWELTEEGEQLVLRGAVGYPAEVLERWREMPLATTEGPAAEAGRTGERVVIRSIADRDERFPSLAGKAYRGEAFLAVPLSVDQRLIGVLGLGFEQADHLDEDALVFIDTAAALCASALHRALTIEERERNLSEAQESARRLAALQRMTAALADVSAGGDTIDFIVEQVSAASGADQVALCVLDENGTSMHTLRAKGMDPQLAVEFGTFPYVAGLPAADALLQRRPILMRDAVERDRLYPSLADREPVNHAWACLPMVIGDRGIGAVALSLPAPQEFSATDLEFLTALADQCGHAVERARLLTVEEANRRRLELLAEAGRIFAAPLDVRMTSLQFSQLVVERFADAVSVHLREQDGSFSLVAAEHIDPDQLEVQRLVSQPLPPLIADAYGAVLDSGQALLTTGVAIDAFLDVIDDAHLREILSRRPARSNIMLPLISGGRHLGVVSISTVADGRPPLREADIEQLEELAGRLALAIDSARLLRQQTEIAHTLQRSLLPASLPQVPGADVAVRYLPGAEGVDVGGDFYDVIPLPSGRIGLVVGDVMGRGIRAAAVMGQLRAAVRSYCLEGHPPAALLTRLDRLVGTLEEGMLVTALYAEWDPIRNTVLCACAGHLPPLVRLPGEQPSFLELDPGVPLGVGSHAYSEVELTLPPGSLLLAYTDGLVEGKDLPVEDGMTRLAAVVADLPGAIEVCDAALQELRPYDPAKRYDDDTALLALVTRATDTPDHPQPTDEDGFTVDLPANNTSPAEARVLVAQQLMEWGLMSLIDAATLLTSELVTNAVRHAGTGLQLTMARLSEGRVRIGVVDRAPGVPVRLRRSNDDAEGGRGLFLVEHLSVGWGSAAGESGKTVWFELQA